jgi:hypothetical protein
MAAGDFSVSALLNIKLKAEAMWADSRLAQDYKANAQSAVALKQNSTATIRPLSEPGKENTVVVTFINSCAVAVRDCDSDCDLTEAELEAGAKTYALDLCKETGFSVNAEKVRTNTYEVNEIAARGLAQSIKVLDEWWAQQVLVKLKAFSGINVSADPYTYASGTTQVPAASYNVSMIPEIMFDAMMNKMNNPFYIDNGGLWVPYTQARLNAGNLDGKGNAAYIDQLKMYFDVWNFGPAGLTEDTFAVSSGAVAFTTKTRNSDTPEVIGGDVNQTRYTIPSSVIPGVKYDVFYTIKCITNATTGEGEIMHVWKLKTRGGIFLNPEGCPVVVGGTTYYPTGVMSYSKV